MKEHWPKDRGLSVVIEKIGIDYEVRDYIGGGGLSRIYSVYHKFSGKLRALKVMDVDYLSQIFEKTGVKDTSKKFENIKERFIREARIFEKISHPNIAKIYDVGFVKDERLQIEIPYLVMEYIEGVTLRDILRESAPLDIETIFRLSEDILTALGEVHKENIVHRDIKPANIMIDKNTGRAILIDFGLAKDKADDKSLTMSGIMGTPAYIAPEIISREKNLGPESDIYSFGVVLYEMVAGEKPFEGGNQLELIYDQFNLAIPDVTKKNPKAPSGLQKIIKKAMAKKPDDRYKNTEELLEALRILKEELKGKTEIKLYKYLVYSLLLIVAVMLILINPLSIGKNQYFSHISSAKKFIKSGDFENAKISLEKAGKIKNTPEIKDLSAQIEALTKQPALEKDFRELEALLKGEAKLDTKIAECHKFLEKYGNIPQNDVTKSIISEVQRNISLFQAGITQQIDKFIAEAEEYLKKGELKNAHDSVKLAKNLGETTKTAELENKIFAAAVSAAEAYCNEAKPQEAEENYLLARTIKPGSNLQDLDKTIKFLRSMPEGVRAVYKVNKQVKQNDQKAWEAEFQDGIIMVYIPSAEGLPGYWMGKTEVSVAQYLKFVNAARSNEPKWQEKGSKFNLETGDDNYYRNQDGNDFPVVGISWENANAYCQWLSRKTGMTFKLPTETQWQNAAQGTDGRLYPWGGVTPRNDLANFFSLATKTVKVDANPRGASPYGLLNMAGNVEEWCDNQFARGGSFYDNEKFITCSSRKKYDPSERTNALGFRVCMSSK